MNNNKFSFWLITILIAVAGVLLIVWHKEADLFSWLIRALGIMLVVPGVYILLNVIGSLRQPSPSAGATTSPSLRHRSLAWSLIIVASATILLGFWMLISPTFFIGLVSYLFATVIILCGILQMVDVAYLSRPVTLPVFFYIMPSLLIIAGIVILFTNVRTIDDIVTLLTGIMLILYSLNRIAQQIVYINLSRSLRKLNP